MTKQRIDEMKKFIQLAEGTWALPNSDEQYQALAELLFGNGRKLNASDMRDAIYSLYGDDELFNMLDDLEDQDPNSDARPYVIDFLKKKDPATFNALYSQGKAQKVSETYDEDDRGDWEYEVKRDKALDDRLEDEDDELEEGFGDKVKGWFRKKNAYQIINDINRYGPMAMASMTMQEPKNIQKATVDAIRYYLMEFGEKENLRKFLDIMAASDDSLFEDAEDDNEPQQFFVALRDGQDYAVVGLEKEGGYWIERLVMGDASNLGSKRYMSYLSTDDIIHWLNRDYDEVSEPFANEWDAEMEMDRMREGEDEDEYMYERVKLRGIAKSVLREAGDLDFDFDDWDTEDAPAADEDDMGEVFEDDLPLEDEDDEFIDPEAMVDVGDDEDFEDNLEEFDLDDLGINIDLEDY